MTSKALDRVSKLLAQAENAGTPEEAATFMEKVQEMATANGIELSVARAHQASKERKVPEKGRKVQVNPMSRRSNKKLFVDLAMHIARVNDVQFLVNDYYLFCTGFSTDIDVVEALYAHLAVQMVAEANQALARGDNKETVTAPKRKRVDASEEFKTQWRDENWEKYDRYHYDSRWGGDAEDPTPTWMYEDVLDDDGNPVIETKELTRVDGRVFRGEFYAGFIQRISSRLWEAKREAEKAAKESLGEAPEQVDLGIVLADKKQKVDEAFAEERAKVAHVGSYKTAGTVERGRSYDARAAGQEAATRVPVGTDQRAI